MRKTASRRWAALIKRVHEVDPLRCPKCGGEMRVIAFIERRQRDVIREILEHCGLWEAPLELRYEGDPDYSLKSLLDAIRQTAARPANPPREIGFHAVSRGSTSAGKAKAMRQ